VKGIRHWSTPTYTRVAIDLGDDVTYEAARVPNPDRIYFDLHGTRLAQELVGKSFAVTDDGFLKKIRAAQFSDDMTRVVLDVNDVTEYSAFLLPNPYRLIIDIHGGTEGERVTTGSSTDGEGVASLRPALPVHSRRQWRARCRAHRDGSGQAGVDRFRIRWREVHEYDRGCGLSQQPGKVEATTRPTSQPISAVVKDAPKIAGGR
jgi:N-acetylmuramoyl-L-alanine amidase